MTNDNPQTRRAPATSSARLPRWARRNDSGTRRETPQVDASEAQWICDLLVPWHAYRTAAGGFATSAPRDDAATHAQWNTAIEHGTLNDEALREAQRHTSRFIAMTMEMEPDTVAVLESWSLAQRRAAATVIEQVALGQPVSPGHASLEAAARSAWGRRASTLARRGGARRGAPHALVAALERAWSATLWNEALVRWNAHHYLDAIARTGDEDAIGAREILQRIGDGFRENWTGSIHGEALDILAALYHRCTGVGQIVAEASTREECGLGRDADEGRRIWNAWVERWARGDTADIARPARRAAYRWNAWEARRRPPEAVDRTFDQWVAESPEWVATLARNIERAIEDRTWDPGRETGQEWPEMLALALYRRLWNLKGGPPDGNIEDGTDCLIAECASRGAQGAREWVDAARNAAEAIERLSASPMVRMAALTTLGGIAHGARQWETACAIVERKADACIEAARDLVLAGDENEASRMDTHASMTRDDAARMRNTIPTPENGAREGEETEEATEETLRDDIDDEIWVAVLETAEHAAQRFPDNARIAHAKALACATLGLRLAAADALATLDAMDDARLHDIVEAGAAIEGRALDVEAMNDAIDAIRKHGVSIPESARTSEATAAAYRRIEDTDIAQESAAAWGEMARSAQAHHARELVWQCRRRVLRHPEPDLRELVDIASEGVDGEGIDVAAPALENAVRACAGSRRNMRRIGALRCEQLALNADIEGYLAQMGEEDEQADAVEGDAQESQAMCREWWVEQLAATLGCSPNEAQGRFDAWKKGTKKATRKLRASLGPNKPGRKFGKRTRSGFGAGLVHEMGISACIGYALIVGSPYADDPVAKAAQGLQMHEEYAAWRAWLAQPRDDDDPMVKTVIATPVLDDFADIVIALDEKEAHGRNDRAQTVH